ncbi:MAG: potassium transporter Kef, partial [Rhodococcus sp. (in: high G+C Gram-positive bacteria)]
MAGRLRRRLLNTDAGLTDRPDFALVGVLRIPEFEQSPWRAIYRRILIALTTLVVAA